METLNLKFPCILKPKILLVYLHEKGLERRFMLVFETCICLLYVFWDLRPLLRLDDPWSIMFLTVSPLKGPKKNEVYRVWKSTSSPVVLYCYLRLPPFCDVIYREDRSISWLFLRRNVLSFQNLLLTMWGRFIVSFWRRGGWRYSCFRLTLRIWTHSSEHSDITPWGCKDDPSTVSSGSSFDPGNRGGRPLFGVVRHYGHLWCTSVSKVGMGHHCSLETKVHSCLRFTPWTWSWRWTIITPPWGKGTDSSRCLSVDFVF